MPKESTIGEEKWDSVKKYKITKMLNDLSKISGHGTELVTVYIPPRKPIYDIISQLRNEAGTATCLNQATSSGCFSPLSVLISS